MTARRFYDDAYTTQFTANVLSRTPLGDNKVGLVLDQTYFYPTSGGQPHDTGWIQGCPVLDVLVDSEHHAIVHIVAGDPKEDMIQAEVNWERRFDHMQHHTGQHILSQAFIRVAGANTASFHLSANSVTIDLDLGDVPTEQLAKSERLANQIVWQNRPVHIDQVTPEEAMAMSVRKVAVGHKGQLRLIEIANFDRTACGGTHVAQTGEVGIIKIVALEKRRKQLRVHFLCGQRALADYSDKNDVINELTSAFTTSYKELGTTTQRLQNELKTTRQRLKQQQGQLLKIEAQELLTRGIVKGNLLFVSEIFTNRDNLELRTLAREITAKPSTVALLALAGPRCHLLFASAPDVPADMTQHLRSALHHLEVQSGGGTPVMAHGGGVPADEERIAEILAQAQSEICATTS